MFSFFKKKGGQPGLSLGALQTDMHSHLIPGIDDGAKDMEDSLELIRGLQALGYRKLITTPHILWDYYPNTPEIITAGLKAVSAELKRQDIDIELHAAAEYLIDDHFIHMLEAGEPLLTLKDNLLLVELSFAVPVLNLKEIIFQLQLKGYQPILAHPERYLYFGADKSWYDQLKNAGCLFQLNLLSLGGYYGKPSTELAEYLIKKQYVDLLGTDLHHTRHLDNLTHNAKIAQTANKLLDADVLKNPGL